MKKQALVSAIVVAILSGEMGMPAMAHNPAPPAGMEKCYGIAKARKNECGTKTGHVCATLSKQDRDPNSWILLPKGTCNKIVGGAIAPSEEGGN